jgi:hypothetical protein
MITYKTVNLDQFCLTQEDYDKHDPDQFAEDFHNTPDDFVIEIAQLHKNTIENLNEFSQARFPFTDEDGTVKYILTDEHACIRPNWYGRPERFWLIKISKYYAILTGLYINRLGDLECRITCYQPHNRGDYPPINIAERVWDYIRSLNGGQ